MKCGCKKSNCRTKVCRCKKAGESCTNECACALDVCQNRPVERVEPEPEPEPEQEQESESESSESEQESEQEPELNSEEFETRWDEAFRLHDAQKNLMVKLRKFKFIPEELQTILQRCQTDFDKMKAILQQMSSLQLERKGELSAEEWRSFQESLKSCQICDRKFAPSRIKSHEEVCSRRTFNK